MKMALSNNKFQSSDNLVGLKGAKQVSGIDHLFAELFALVNLNEDKLKMGGNPEINNSNIQNKYSSIETKNSSIETKNSSIETKNSSIETKNSIIKKNIDLDNEKTLDLAKSLAEVFFKEVGISEDIKINQKNDIPVNILDKYIPNKTVIDKKNNLIEEKIKNQPLNVESQIIAENNSKKTTSQNLVFIVKKVKKNEKESKNNFLINQGPENKKTSELTDKNAKFLKENISVNNNYKENTKEFLGQQKEKKIQKKKSHNDKLLSQNNENKVLTNKTDKDIPVKIINTPSKNIKQNNVESTINIKDNHNKKNQISEKPIIQGQNFHTQKTLDLLESSWGEKFTKIIKNSIKNEISKIDISLKPRNLGKINVEIQLKDNQTFVQINAESSEAAHILNDNLSKINDIIEERNNKFSNLFDNNNNFSNNKDQQKNNSNSEGALSKNKVSSKPKEIKNQNHNVDVNA